MKRLVWVGVIALLVLIARWLAYALAAPSPLGSRLEASAGGPNLVLVTLVAVGIAVLISVFVVWLAAVAVGERQHLRPKRVVPRLRPGRLALRAVGLFTASSLVFAGFESYLHWRAGIGFHGLACLFGPVHRNAIALLAALSLAAAAIAEAGAHVIAWMRAVLRALGADLLVPEPAEPVIRLLLLLHARPAPAESRPRAPPVPA